MKTPPKFWSNIEGAKHPVAIMFAPLSGLYHTLGQLRWRFTKPEISAKPVICIGNVTLGGVGKTPFTAMLARELQALGQQPHIVSRGYGGSEKGPLRVSDANSAAEVGDEPLLHAQIAPTWIGRKRGVAADAAINAGADVILLDDGLQNPTLQKSFSFLLIDSEESFGNGAIFPAGPLRELPEEARERSDCVVFVKPNRDAEVIGTLRRFAKPKLMLDAWLEADASHLDSTMRYFAFCGIGRPAKFYTSLEEAGLTIIAKESFPDHHPFEEATVIDLIAQAKAVNAAAITTEKDLMRIPQHLRKHIKTLPVKMQVSDRQKLIQMLSPILDVPRSKA